jgi:hypothetical protein
MSKFETGQQLVWATEFHSRKKGRVWVVLNQHPSHAKSEHSLLSAKAKLQLKRAASGWKQWPNPFVSRGRCRVFREGDDPSRFSEGEPEVNRSDSCPVSTVTQTDGLSLLLLWL